MSWCVPLAVKEISEFVNELLLIPVLVMDVLVLLLVELKQHVLENFLDVRSTGNRDKCRAVELRFKPCSSPLWQASSFPDLLVQQQRWPPLSSTPWSAHHLPRRCQPAPPRFCTDRTGVGHRRRPRGGCRTGPRRCRRFCTCHGERPHPGHGPRCPWCRRQCRGESWPSQSGKFNYLPLLWYGN